MNMIERDDQEKLFNCIIFNEGLFIFMYTFIKIKVIMIKGKYITVTR